MKAIEVFIQGAAIPEILVATAGPADTVVRVLGALERPIALDGETLVFLEDGQGALDPETPVEELLPMDAHEEAIAVPLRLHVGKCRQVEVSVRFNGERSKRRFPPGATIGRVHHWAARRAFGLSPRDAAEHVLQIAGTDKRPDRDVHVGTLTGGDVCSVGFDLVPRKRVEG